MSETWSNWSGAVRCSPAELASPIDEAGLREALARAARRDQPVRPLGAGHSSSQLLPTDGMLVCLDALAGLVWSDPEAGLARVRAGTRLHDLGEPLFERGLALANLGDIDRQALGGALATATHGTGQGLGNIASNVHALRLVTAAGDVVECDDEDPELLRAARVSLGALGIVSEVTLRVVPAFRLYERVWRGPVEPLLEGLDALVSGHRHFEFFYFPKHDFAEAKSLDESDLGDDELAGRKGERVGWSHRIIPSEREQKFHEMEYSLPAEAGPACFDALRRRLRTHHPDLQWPLEYRTVAADDAFLSMAHGRPTVSISVHEDGARPYRDLFGQLEPLLLEHGGRPHWGKVHGADAAQLAPRYPDWERFLAVRARLDPEGRFLSEGLRRLLGA